MPSNLRFTRYAVPDLREACDWYDGISLNLGQRFREAVNAALDQIEQSPHAAPFVKLGKAVRFVRPPRFPYLVLYRVEGEIAFIMGVAHANADLQPWLERDLD